MKALLAKIHARVGDLWWYSAMIFIACRFGDVINAFVGLWLVPKYVGPQELGAVLPLQQLTSFLTVPIGIVAIVFAKQVNTYAARGEYGKVKGFIRDVLGISTLLFIICIAGAYLIMPFFYERLRISSGLLTALILASGFVASIGSLIASAQQGLKRFKMMSILSLVTAPVRLGTMLVAMPIRALSGYILGQTTPGIVTTFFSAIDIRTALRPYTPNPAWRKDWREILNYTWPIAINTIVGAICATACFTVYRQRLSPTESGAFYLITRFSDVATYVGSSISAVLFPLVSEAHEQGKDPIRMVFKTNIVLFAVILLLIAGAWLTHSWLFSLSKTWADYQSYSYLLPVIMLYTGIGLINTNFITYETACRRFGAMFWVMIGVICWNTFLVTFTGAEFFRGKLPDCIVDWVVSVHAARLGFLSYLAVPYLVITLIGILLIIYYNKRKRIS